MELQQPTVPNVTVAQPVTKTLLSQILKFAVIGVINTGIDFAILNLLMYFTEIKSGNGLILLNAISFTAAVINSYLLNKRWAFNDHAQGDAAKKFSVFLAVSLIGLAINTAVVRIGSDYNFINIDQQLWNNVAKIAATGISLVWNFVGYKLFVFNK